MTDVKIAGAVQYQFTEGNTSEASLANLTNEALSQRIFTPCGDHDARKVGFTPFSEGEFILETVNYKAVMITEQTKKPNSAEVNRRCKKKEAEYIVENNLEEGKVDKETKDLIKLAIIESMLPETSAGKEVTTLVWIHGDNVTVGCPSYNKAEDMVDMLRLAVGTLPVEVLDIKDVSETLTDHVKKGYDDRMYFWDKVEMVTEDKGVVKLEKGSVYQALTKPYLDKGAFVVKLQYQYDGAIIFTLNDKLELSGIKVDKDVLCNAKDLGAAVVTMDELIKVFNEIKKVFGG